MDYYQQQQQMQQIRDGGIVPFRNDQEVYTYPVAPGYQVAFINLMSGVIYKKTVFYNYPQPQIERFLIVPDKQEQPQNNQQNDPFAAIMARMDALEKKMTEEAKTNE